MADFFMYLLEVSALLALFYVLYVLTLKRETFFSLNRFFLIGILASSLLFPFVSFDISSSSVVVVERPIEEISKFRNSYFEALASWEFNRSSASAIDGVSEVRPEALKNGFLGQFFSLLLVVYAIGIVVCMSRLIWTLLSLRNLIRSYPQEKIDDATVIKMPHAIAPFSFLKYVFVNSSQMDTPDFDRIIAHEKIHIRQKHSIDLIFVQLLAAFLWFNPVVWQLIKSLKTTHEYIADSQIIKSGYSLVEYQTLLLSQLISNNSFGLVHNFNLSFIKKRIIMMNTKSGWSGKVKVAVAIVCTIIFSGVIVQCNSKLEEQVAVESDLISKSNVEDGLSLPVLPDMKDPVVLDLQDALDISIIGDKLFISGEEYDVEEIVPLIKKRNFVKPVTIVMNIDKNQQMDFVSIVQLELRKADQRKILYIGETAMGTKVEVPLLLPPYPYSEYGENGPTNDELSSAGLDVLKIDMGDKNGSLNQQTVYDFVQSHMKKQSSDYVVSARFDDEDTYDNFLVNLVLIKAGFNQIYQERAQEMFGKDFFGLGKKETASVREGVPMAISIAEGE